MTYAPVRGGEEGVICSVLQQPLPRLHERAYQPMEQQPLTGRQEATLQQLPGHQCTAFLTSQEYITLWTQGGSILLLGADHCQDAGARHLDQLQNNDYLQNSKERHLVL